MMTICRANFPDLIELSAKRRKHSSHLTLIDDARRRDPKEDIVSMQTEPVQGMSLPHSVFPSSEDVFANLSPMSYPVIGDPSQYTKQEITPQCRIGSGAISVPPQAWKKKDQQSVTRTCTNSPSQSFSTNSLDSIQTFQYPDFPTPEWPATGFSGESYALPYFFQLFNRLRA